MASVMGTTSASNVIDVDVYARGEDGVGIRKTELYFQLSDNGSTIPTGTWLDTLPTPEQGKYLWVKTVFTYTNDSRKESYNVSYYAIDGEKGDTGDYYYPRFEHTTSGNQVILWFDKNGIPGESSIEGGNVIGPAGAVKIDDGYLTYTFSEASQQGLLPSNPIAATYYVFKAATATASNKFYDL